MVICVEDKVNQRRMAGNLVWMWVVILNGLA